MAIYCEDLFKLNTFQNTILRAGKNGMSRKITWPYVGSAPTVAQWLHGGELLFLTGVGIPSDAENLFRLVEECIKKDLAGIVFLLNSEYIPEIPDSIIEIANHKNFPIFEMPWNEKLIDATQEIVSLMNQERESAKNFKFFLETLIFSNDYNLETLSKFYEISLHRYVCLAMAVAAENGLSDTIKSNFQHLESSVRNLSFSNRLSVFTCPYADHLIFLMTADTKNDINYIQNTLENNFEYISAMHPHHPMFLALSNICEDPTQIKNCYCEIVKTLSIKNLNTLFPNRIIHYNNLGIYKLLFELDKSDSLKKYCLENIGVLITYDQQHSSNLLDTLKHYFLNNCHITQTASALFIHKNTLIYRLSTIKGLLNTDLNNALINLELFNSIIIYEYLSGNTSR